MWVLRELLCKLLHCCTANPEPKFQLKFWSPENPSFQIKGDNLMLGALQVGQRTAFVVEPRGRLSGEIVTIDGPVTAFCDHPSVIATVNEDGLSGYFELPADAGLTEQVSALFTVEFDADLGDGFNTQTLTAAGILSPEQAGANNSTFTLGEPEDIPTA